MYFLNAGFLCISQFSCNAKKRSVTSESFILTRPGLSSLSFGQGALSPAFQKSLKLTLTSLDWNKIWHASLKVFSYSLTQKFTSQTYPSHKGSESSNSDSYPQKMYLTCAKLVFMSGIFFWPKIDSPCQCQQFPSRGRFVYFLNFYDVSMRKEQQQSPPLFCQNISQG